MYPYKVSTAGHVAKACFVTKSRNRPSNSLQKEDERRCAMTIFFFNKLKWKEKNSFDKKGLLFETPSIASSQRNQGRQVLTTHYQVQKLIDPQH